MTSKPDHDQDATESSTPGRPHDTSRQQKHQDQHLDSGSESLDRRTGREGPRKAPKPPGAK
jgi:hypothetical protein